MRSDRVMLASAAFIVGALDGWVAVVMFALIIVVAYAGDHNQHNGGQR